MYRVARSLSGSPTATDFGERCFKRPSAWRLWPRHSPSRRTTGFCVAPSTPASGQETRVGILLDTKTTGLDHYKDEVIELGMVKFDCTPDGRFVRVRDTFSAFNEPSEPIPAEITALTGITDQMVASHRIDEAA